ncbi:SNAP25 homologous protein SNAP33 [Sesamum angolense]|uniref:SNAP25 homologous protein SNAP33 n=1 Tax=Sesamum angolense TaxID=2727404 RepID=A0AAE1WLL9_9LAMI|nr:SNAP25 homologous protein SNAP33 [Sesamum angolense]
MFGLKKSPLHRFSKHNSADPGFPVNNRANPFDSDDELDTKQTLKSSGRTSSHELDNKQTLKTSGRTSSEPSLFTSDMSTNPFDDVEIKGTSSSQNYLSSAAKNKYKNDFHDSGGLENQTVQELENYAGEQITRTHMVAADMDHDLSRGEKLLGSLGGIFSKTWKPKKTRPITGPIITRDDPVQRRGNHLEQRERLGLSSSKERSHTRTPPPEPTDALQKVEVEKVKQDDALSDLSNILGELKDMAIDMGSEIERQNKALDHVQDDVEELNFRVKDFLDINPELLQDVLFLLSGIETNTKNLRFDSTLYAFGKPSWWSTPMFVTTQLMHASRNERWNKMQQGMRSCLVIECRANSDVFLSM